jgi:hypothetical protein
VATVLHAVLHDYGSTVVTMLLQTLASATLFAVVICLFMIKGFSRARGRTLRSSVRQNPGMTLIVIGLVWLLCFIVSGVVNMTTSG